MKKYYLSALVALVYIPVVTIGAELWKPLKDFFKNLFWHHWLGKSLVLLILFGISLIIFHYTLSTDQSPDKKESDENYLTGMLWITFLGAGAIFVFFAYEFFQHL